MKHLFQIALALVPALCLGEGRELAHPNHPNFSINLDSPDVIKDLGEGKLKVWILEKGIRSEGLHGELVGMEDPSEKVSFLQTPSGKIVYRGDWVDRPSLWAASGWLPDDLDAPLIREEKLEFPISPVRLALKIESALKGIVEAQDRRIAGEAKGIQLSYSMSLEKDVISFSLKEGSGITSSTFTHFEVRFAEKTSKWEEPKDRSVLLIRSFTLDEKTQIEELDLLSYRLRQIKGEIVSR